MTIEISILIAVIGCFVGLGGWLKGRDGKIATDAEWKGTINAKLDVIVGIGQDVKELEDKIIIQDKKLGELEQSCKSAHKRLDGLVK